MNKRVNISKLEWDYSSLTSGVLDEQIEKEKEIIREKVSGFVSKWKGRSDYLESPEVLKEALDEFEYFMGNFGMCGDVGHYLWLRKMKDQSDEEIKAKYSLIDDFSDENSNALVFFELNISKISEDKQKKFLNSEALKNYCHYLEKLFRSGKHCLSEEVENVLTLKSGPAYEFWVDMTSGLLSKSEGKVFTGKRNEIKNFSEIQALLDSSNSEVRDSCALVFNEVLEKYSDIAVAEINAVLKDKKINDELRGFSRPDESRIVRDDIDFEFIDSLIDSVSARFDVAKRFYELKAKLLGVKKLKYHERNVSYGSSNQEISYSEAVDIVGCSFENMDKDFFEVFRELIEGGGVDVYPKKGKRQGAFCSYGLKIHPTNILLNYMDRPYDVMVLAHEFGHGLNHEFMKKRSSLDFGNSMAMAEVASTFAETIVFEDLLKNVESDEERLSLLVAKVGSDLASVVRQVACYKFEKELHLEFRKKGSLSKEGIGGIFRKNMEAYMGDYIEQSEGSENWWVYWPHIRDFFYVYSYSSGVLISNAMVKRYKENPDFILKVKEFFSVGNSKSPRTAFGDLGISLDGDFWDEGFDNIEKLLDETWRLAEKLGKI
jgi:oligoendopeptidase F